MKSMNPLAKVIRTLREADKNVDRLADPTPTDEELIAWPGLIRRQTPGSNSPAGSSSS